MEARELTFNQVKAHLQENPGTVVRHCADLVSFTGVYAKDEKLFDFVSLSDVPSYFEGEMEKNFLQTMSEGLAVGATLVLRSYLRVPQMDMRGFSDISEQFLPLISQEKTAVYRIQILRKN